MVTLPITLSAPKPPQTTTFSAFCTAIHSFVTGKPRYFIFGTLTFHSKSHPAEEKSSVKGAWSGLSNSVRVTRAISALLTWRKFRHSKSSVYMWHPQLVRGRFVYDTRNVCRVLRRDLPIKRRLRAKKLAGELPTTARGSEEVGAKCVATVDRELLRIMMIRMMIWWGWCGLAC